MIQINFKWILALISTLIPKSTQSELNIPVSQKYHNKYCETSISILVSSYYHDTIKDENNFPLNHRKLSHFWLNLDSHLFWMDFEDLQIWQMILNSSIVMEFWKIIIFLSKFDTKIFGKV